MRLATSQSSSIVVVDRYNKISLLHSAPHRPATRRSSSHCCCHGGCVSMNARSGVCPTGLPVVVVAGLPPHRPQSHVICVGRQYKRPSPSSSPRLRGQVNTPPTTTTIKQENPQKNSSARVQFTLELARYVDSSIRRRRPGQLVV